jgi:hypothetical protein
MTPDRSIFDTDGLISFAQGRRELDGQHTSGRRVSGYLVHSFREDGSAVIVGGGGRIPRRASRSRGIGEPIHPEALPATGRRWTPPSGKYDRRPRDHQERTEEESRGFFQAHDFPFPSVMTHCRKKQCVGKCNLATMTPNSEDGKGTLPESDRDRGDEIKLE